MKPSDGKACRGMVDCSRDKKGGLIKPFQGKLF